MAIDFFSTNPEDAGPTQINYGPERLPPEELEKRKTGWKALLAKWDDPNVRAAVVQTGLGLMKSPSYGQSGWDVGANALQAGVGTLQSMRERDRLLAEQAAERKKKETQQEIENKRGERQVSATEKNAATQARQVDSTIAANQAAGTRADRELTEKERHNKETEKADLLRAEAARVAAAGGGKGHKTSAEIEKINRLKAYYKQKNPSLTDEDVDKMAIDYVANSKGKPPRQLVVEAYQAKAKQWYDQQFDPTASPPPELQQQWKNEAIEEIRSLEAAGQAITNKEGVVPRPGGTPPAVSAPTAATAPGTPNPATTRSIELWKSKAATPEQIKILIAAGGENPSIYGY